MTAGAARVEGGGWRPTADQERLLQAALLEDGAAALAAYRAWRGGVALDDVDGASYRLLPLLFRNLGDRLDGDPDQLRLRGTYRRAWYRNRLLLRDAEPVYRALDEAGVPHIALKGAALGALHYRDAGARPMEDLDVLVPLSRARDAIEALVAIGWEPGRPLEHIDRQLALVHSLAFLGRGLSDAHPPHVDVHWRPLYDGFHDALDAAMWARSVPLELPGISTRALDATDELLHICVHGLRWNPVPPIRWVADAVVVARGSTIDWDRLAGDASRRGLAPALARVLGYVDGRFGYHVPSEALRMLRRARVTPYARFSFWARTARPSRSSTAAQVFVVTFADRTRGQSVHERLRGYPSYLKGTFGQDSMRGVARRVITASARDGDGP